MSEQNDKMFPSHPFKMQDGTEVEYIHDYVIHWFSTSVYDRVMALSQEEKERYFEMITEYGDLLSKIINDPNHVIFEYAQDKPNPWLSLEKHAEQSNAIVDYELPTQMVKEYTEWRLKRDGLI